MRTTLILFTLLTLASCQSDYSDRYTLDVECFDDSGLLVHKDRVKEFTLIGDTKKTSTSMSKCIVTSTGEK